MFFKTDIETFEQLEADSVVHLRKKINSMKGIKAPKQSIALAILRMLPFASKFIDSLEGAGSTINRLVMAEGIVNHATTAAAEGFHIIKLLTGITDFVVVPIIYFGAYITNQKVPFTLSRNARFVYATVVLGLTITALAFPPAAPIIALVTSIAALGLSLITLTKLYYKRFELEDKLVNTKQQVETEKNRLKSLINYLEKLEADAKKAKEDGKLEDYKTLESKIESERITIKEQFNSLQELLNDQVRCEQKLEKLRTTAVWDKSAGVAFASLALIGAIVSLIAPPAGLGILAVAASLGIAYTVARLTFPLFKSLANKIVNYSTRKSEPTKQDNEEPAEKEALTESEFDSSAKRVKRDMPDIEKIAERLEHTVASEPITHSGTQPDQSAHALISETLFKPVSQKDEDDEESEGIKEQNDKEHNNLMQ
ncbi:hypothetical protein OQJ13_09440 [Legionella sp. PATHC035]|uniref:hypothetical protein n=1 Tax=Legionella sp. PATHC035 TaxID=2992040 RepID=UPI0022446DAB|nr:hypothetical protein [Legionella sp. PATHC035]MCW8409195.1 hypothetical protein [Legionella sp. PATHC035]